MTDELRVVAHGRSETEAAKQHRDAVEAKLRELLALMDAAKGDGMIVNFNIGQDAFGRNSIQSLAVTKVLA